MKSSIKILPISAMILFILVACNKNLDTSTKQDLIPAVTFKQSSFQVGQQFGGGIIFYIDSTGLHGLIAAKADTEEPALWAYKDSLLGVRSSKVGAGKRNTRKTYLILGDQGEGSDYAALRALEYTYKGLHDWYLPSKEELNLLYMQKEMIGGFSPFAYWSSTEFDENLAWFQNFSNGQQIKSDKITSYAVRPIRSF